MLVGYADLLLPNRTLRLMILIDDRKAGIDFLRVVCLALPGPT
jgi:hypothetical protein